MRTKRMSNRTNDMVLSLQTVGGTEYAQIEVTASGVSELYTFSKDEAVALASSLLQFATKMQ